MQLTADIIVAATGSTAIRAQRWLQPLGAAMARYQISTPLRVAAWLANLGHESSGMSALEENLNYSAAGLANTWPTRFARRDEAGRPVRGVDGRCEPNDLARQLHRQPQRIANVVYANRMGNGDEASGDGWRHRGMGPIQITGKDNQRRCGLALGVDLVARPELLLAPEIGAMSAAWFWHANNINEHADRGDFDGVCDEINLGRKTVREGDSIGYSHRLALYTAGLRHMGVTPSGA